MARTSRICLKKTYKNKKNNAIQYLFYNFVAITI